MKFSGLAKRFQKENILKCLRVWLGAGTSPEKLAFSITLGFVFGVFPMFGIPTVLCSLAAAVWRLNFPALQAVNYLVYPLQIALMWPLIRWGAVLFGGAYVAHGWAVGTVLATALHTTAAWLCFAAPAGLIVYFALRLLLRWQRA